VTGLADIVRNPIYSTAVGLLLYGGEQQRDGLVLPSNAGMVTVVGRVKNWLTGSYG
jgi:cell division protein FtsA